MKSYKHKMGVTLVEILIAVAIVVILVSTVISVAVRINSQAREQLAESTIAILDAALEQFSDYEYQYSNLVVDYSAFDFPLDCNGFNAPTFQTTLEEALGLNPGSVLIVGFDRNGAEYGVVDHDVRNSGCEAMCFFLNRVPEIRKILERIDSSLITSDGFSGNTVITRTIRVDGRDYALLRIIDPWGRTLRYSYYDRIMDVFRTFPLITSAGPDRRFDTIDDITNR